MKRAAIIFFLMLTGSYNAFGQQLQHNETFKKANQLYANHQENQALDAYLLVLKNEPANYTALWKASFLYSRIGNRFKEKSKKVDYFNKARLLAKKALDIDSTDAHSNFVMSVAMGRMALISSPKARVAASGDIKHYAEQALKYDPEYAGAWDVLGRWNYKVANLNFAEKLAANLLFGGLPKGASDQNAINDFKKAITIESDNIMYHIDLAKVYMTEDMNNEAIQTLQKMLKLKPVTPDDPRYIKEAHQMLKKLQ